MDVEYISICNIIVEKLSPILLANMEPIYWSVRLSIKGKGWGVKGGIVILGRYVFYFIRDDENLV